MRDDLLKFIRKQKDVTNVVITTFNIDFLFIENILLGALRRCGDPSLTVFADHDEVTRTFAAQSRWVGRIGRRYRVVPVRMAPGFRFHPKTVLVSGAEKASLFVGSGNLTFGGMRQNDELWLRFDSGEDSDGVFSGIRQLLNACVERADAGPVANRDIVEAFAPDNHIWAGRLPEPEGLVFHIGESNSLLAQYAEVLEGTAPERVTVGCPYFDEEGRALQAIGEKWPDAVIRVIVQPSHCTLTRAVAESLPDRFEFIESTGREREGRQAFIHAKFMAFERDGQATVFVGSANCSVAALLLNGNIGNAELMAVVKMTADELQIMILDELKLGDSLITSLPESIEATLDDNEFSVSVRIATASLDLGILKIHYFGSSNIVVDQVCCDGHELPKFSIDAANSVIHARVSGRVSRARLSGVIGGERFETPDHWIDHEYLLSASSRQRRVAAAIEASVSDGAWGFQAWSEILRLMGSHLQYTPARSSSDTEGDGKGKADDGRLLSLSEFYSSGYRAAHEPSTVDAVIGQHRIGSLKSLLMEYLGVEGIQDSVDGESEEEITDEDSAETVDRVERNPEKSSGVPIKRAGLTDREQNRGRRLATEIIGRLADPEFLQHRPPTLLANDFTIGAVLVIAGFAEKWLSGDNYLDLTHGFWTTLFFDDGKSVGEIGRQRGWLERICADSDNANEIQSSLAQPTLAGAFLIWCLSCPSHTTKAERIQFRLAARLAIARLPWLWCLRDPQTIKEARRIATSTGWLTESGSTWIEIQDEWESLVNEALALRRLEEVVALRPLSDWRERMGDRDINEGALLWQGPKMGFGVLETSIRRGTMRDKSVSVRLLRHERPETKIMPSYLVPLDGIASILNGEVEPYVISSLKKLLRSLETN